MWPPLGPNPVPKLDLQPLDLQPLNPTGPLDLQPLPDPDKSLFNKIFDFTAEPLTDLPTRAAENMSKEFFQPLRQNIQNPWLASGIGLAEGLNEGLGHTASSLT